MLLFLDVISPIPEFFIIEENKLIFREKIIINQSEKLSDHIFDKYMKINKKLNLTKYLEKIAMTIGPGSYTSLRVGSAFLSGLRISMNLKFCPISVKDIIKFKVEKSKIANVGFFICSSKNQNFFCNINSIGKLEYLKLENDKFNLIKKIDTIFYNSRELNVINKKIKQFKFSFIDETLSNNKKLEFDKEILIKPIYISNNKILN